MQGFQALYHLHELAPDLPFSQPGAFLLVLVYLAQQVATVCQFHHYAV